LPTQRDRDRVLYAGNFARLAEITQVTSPERGYVFHNRLTHSLKVAQIARRIAEKFNREDRGTVSAIGGIDVDSAETAGLAHDLGHPPFGHIAEDELNRLVREAGLRDGFEGNAQSFRIVNRLAVSDARTADPLPIPGLNLTRQSLNGILKYPWAHGENPDYPNKWGYYDSERDVFEWVRGGSPAFERSSIAEIMDWADDITFAVHDLIDFYRAGRIPIDRCRGPQSVERDRLMEGIFTRKEKWRSEAGLYEEALQTLVEEFPFEADERYTGSVADEAKLFDFSTSLIGTFVNSIHLRHPSNPGGGHVEIDPEARRVIEILKQFIWEYVIENPELSVPQQGQKFAVKEVFGRLLAAVLEGTMHLLPPPYSTPLPRPVDRAVAIRLAADCVAGMTEKELMRFHRCLQGLNGSF
jgi:dGTPase